MTEKAPKRPRDSNQLAKHIVDLATGAADEAMPSPLTKAQEFAREGGRIGGKARAAKLSKSQRSSIARDAANARWRNDKEFKA